MQISSDEAFLVELLELLLLACCCFCCCVILEVCYGRGVWCRLSTFLLFAVCVVVAF